MEEEYQVAFDLISHAGTAKSSALEAIDFAIEGDFDAAENAIVAGREEMAVAHDVQFSVISREASGDSVGVNVILVHALDHLTMAIMALDMAERFIAVLRAR